MGWFILVLEVQICFWSLAAWTPASCTGAFPLCIPVLYGELIPPSSLSLISPPPLSNKPPIQKEVRLWLPTPKHSPIHKFIVNDSKVNHQHTFSLVINCHLNILFLASEPNLKVKSRLKAKIRNYGSPLLYRRRDRHNGSRMQRSFTCKYMETFCINTVKPLLSGH